MKSAIKLLLVLILLFSNIFLWSFENKDIISKDGYTFIVTYRDYLSEDDLSLPILSFTHDERKESYYRVTDENGKELLCFAKYSALYTGALDRLAAFYKAKMPEGYMTEKNDNNVIMLAGSVDDFVRVTLSDESENRVRLIIENVRFYNYSADFDVLYDTDEE